LLEVVGFGHGRASRVAAGRRAARRGGFYGLCCAAATRN